MIFPKCVTDRKSDFLSKASVQITKLHLPCDHGVHFHVKKSFDEIRLGTK